MVVVYCDAAHDSDACCGAIAFVVVRGSDVSDVVVRDFTNFLGTTQDLEYIAVRAAMAYIERHLVGACATIFSGSEIALRDAARIANPYIQLEWVGRKRNLAHKYAVRRLRQLRASVARAYAQADAQPVPEREVAEARRSAPALVGAPTAT
ncbi:MAG: hypothetical protein QXT00_08015 [Ignisphaera sp.]